MLASGAGFRLSGTILSVDLRSSVAHDVATARCRVLCFHGPPFPMHSDRFRPSAIWSPAWRQQQRNAEPSATDGKTQTDSEQIFSASKAAGEIASPTVPAKLHL